MNESINTAELIKLISRGTIWNLGNDLLYRLCKDHPGHKSAEEITAKVWLIGRAYAAAIERGRTMEGNGDDFYETKVVPGIITSGLDEQLDKVRQYKEIDSHSVPTILETHKFLTNIFADIAEKDKRSLASKYLHFHFPNLFFLYDSRAVKGARELLTRHKVEMPTQYVDHEYGRFFLKVVYLRDLIQEREGRFLTPREIDNILINISARVSR